MTRGDLISQIRLLERRIAVPADTLIRVESILATAALSAIGVFAFSRFANLSVEFATYNAVGWMCVSISIHRFVVILKRHG